MTISPHFYALQGQKKETMADSFAQVLVHLTFHAKSGGVTMERDDLPRIFQYIGGIVRSLKGIPMAVGGMPDHVHILSSLPRTISIADFTMNVKKSSSKWIKGLGEKYSNFAWQDGYGIFSVSYSIRNQVVGYILHQEEHHRRQTFKEELKAFLEANGIDYDERYL